jgi:hypothetical protein
MTTIRTATNKEISGEHQFERNSFPGSMVGVSSQIALLQLLCGERDAR